MSGSLSLTGINVAFPNAVIYSGSDSFWNGLMTFGKNAFDSFSDSFFYYVFHGFTFEVIKNFVFFFLSVLAVAFVSSLVFGWWFGSRSGIGGRIEDTFNSLNKKL